MSQLNVAMLTRRPNAVAHRPCAQALDEVTTYWREQLERVLPDRPDLVVLPETCDGADEAPMERYQEFVRQRGDQLLNVFAGLARRHRLWITLPTLRLLPDGTLRNSIYLLDRGGEIAGIYDKTFPMIREVEAGILPGPMPDCIDTEFGKVACAICFDLNFTELCRHYARQQPDLVLFSSVYHGGLAQRMWAYTCQAHFVGAIDKTPGQILSPLGETLASTTNYTSCVTTRINTDCRLVHLDYHWEKLERLKRELGPRVTIHDPGLVGSVLITNLDESATIDDLLQRFELEPVSSYLDRARQVCAANRQATPTSEPLPV